MRAGRIGTPLALRRADLVALLLVSAGQLISESFECCPRNFVGHFGVDLHRDGDLSVPKNRHRDAGVYVKRRQE